MRFTLMILALGLCFLVIRVESEIPKSLWKDIDSVNKVGPYIGVAVPNGYEMNPLLQSASFMVNQKCPYLDISGRRFRIGTIESQRVIIVMTGKGMQNAAIATQLLLSLFNVKGVLHFGIAGNANNELQIGDVVIPKFWAHTGLWSWQRYRQGPENESDYTSNVTYLKFSDYNYDTTIDNLLSSVQYDSEQVFPIKTNPETIQHAFWVPVDMYFFTLSRKLEGLKLERCINATTCLPRAPKVARVERGVSANMFIDNGAYSKFINSKFNATPIDMESASVALVCYQQDVPFIAIRSLSDLAGGGSAISNEASTFAPLAAQNAVATFIRFVKLLPSRWGFL